MSQGEALEGALDRGLEVCRPFPLHQADWLECRARLCVGKAPRLEALPCTTSFALTEAAFLYQC